MNLIKPKKLEKGDTIGFIATSGDIENRQKIENAKRYFEDKGFNVVFSQNIFDKNRYFAGADDERAKAVNDFFADSKIDAIFCVRGGYGAIRLLDKINYDSIKNNPKIFCGHSDISILLAMLYKKTGLVSFHSPMPYGDFSKDIDITTEKSFFDILKAENQDGYQAEKPFYTYYQGVANGVLWGGNLATISSLAGLDFIPSEPFIFFAEDICEPVYKIDKMFAQLFNIKEFRDNLAGIILGDFSATDDEKDLFSYFSELSQSIKVPMMNGFKIGHERTKITIPIGIKAQIDTNQGFLKFLETPFS